jgi:hypothetical protein
MPTRLRRGLTAELIRQQAGRRPNAVVIVAPGRPDLT